MADSLDALLTARVPVTGRRAANGGAGNTTQRSDYSSAGNTTARGSPPPQSSYSNYSASPVSSGAGARKDSYSDNSSSYNSRASPPAASAYGGLNLRNAAAEKENSYARQSPTHGSSAAHEREGSISGTDSGKGADWSVLNSYKAARARAGSAANAAPSPTGSPPQVSYVPSAAGPSKSAAAGLSDSFLAARSSSMQAAGASSPAAAAPGGSQADDTVIGGAVIFPARQALKVDASEALQPLAVKRNPFASPSSGAAAGSPSTSSFATASSLMTRQSPTAGPRPAPVQSPTGAAAAPGAESVRAPQTFSCPDCGRNFKRGSLMKHQKVCKKVFKQKRSQFDSKGMRTQDIAGLVPQSTADDDLGSDCEEADDDGSFTARPKTSKPKRSEETKEQHSEGGQGEKPAPSWKDQSEGLREAMRRAKKEKAVFGASNKLGIDLGKMMYAK